MKKRIGTKLYDTDTSEKIADVGVGVLYRKRTRKREWFLLIGDHIEPMEEPEAKALLGKTSYREKPVKSKRIMIGVDRETHNRIARAANRSNMKIAEFMKKWAETL